MEEITWRKLEENDFDKGYLELLKELTYVGNIGRESFCRCFRQLDSDPNIFILVAESNTKLIASGTLLVEPKFVHNCKSVGHIEDIVVSRTHRRSGIGKRLIESLVLEAKKRNCYKIILNCSTESKPFYEKCGFREREVEMALYFES
eukprot:jgi/Galph1/5324/GphlegSOOS_G3901.1